MHIKTDIIYTLSLEETLEMSTYLNLEQIPKLLKCINKYIAYKDDSMVSTWAYANHYVPSGKKPPTEPKGTFKPNSFLFKALDSACIIISIRKGDYIRELRVQLVPLPL